MRWVTWQDVGVDRMGCAWLITRFIDPQSVFVFIPQQSPLPPDAEPFDIPGARLSHHRGHASFHAICLTYDLRDPVLLQIARMIDEVDALQEVTLEAAAPGLDLICAGLRRISPDDQTAIERGMLVYDALYAQLCQGNG